MNVATEGWSMSPIGLIARVLNPPDARNWMAYDVNAGTWFVGVFTEFFTGQLIITNSLGPYSFTSLRTVWVLEPDQ